MILIKDGRVVDPKSKTDEVRDLVLDGDTIINIGKFHRSDDYDRIIEAKGLIVAPGLVDVNTHFGDPALDAEENLADGERAAFAGGYTTVVCRSGDAPALDDVRALCGMLAAARRRKLHIYTTAALTKGFLGSELSDMAALKEHGAVGFTNGSSAIMDSHLMLEAMRAGSRLGIPVSVHDADPSYVVDIGINESAAAQELGLGGTPNLAEDLMVARDCMLALHSGCVVVIQHVSSGASVDLIRMVQGMGAQVVAQVAPHHFSLTDDEVRRVGPLAKTDPPLRGSKDRFEILEGLRDGTLKIISTDHCPNANGDGDGPPAATPAGASGAQGIQWASADGAPGAYGSTSDRFAAGASSDGAVAPSPAASDTARAFRDAACGFVGLETALALSVTHLVRKGHLTMWKLIQKMSLNPANLYHLDAGYIAEGAKANLVIFSETESFTVTKGMFHSRATNSPFIGQKLYGKVKYTICDGDVVYQSI
ncbi:MAG: dihydroorotase [Lachnospiraceae bacterium]|jgi:dihydroorotase|nr:dihydroorotase [Lachnospiraceae bacterium]